MGIVFHLDYTAYKKVLKKEKQGSGLAKITVTVFVPLNWNAGLGHRNSSTFFSGVFSVWHLQSHLQAFSISRSHAG